MEHDAGGNGSTDDRRRRLIVERAMHKTLSRGFGQRTVAQDWREAEREVDDELAREIRDHENPTRAPERSSRSGDRACRSN
jgi:hypothetical protein